MLQDGFDPAPGFFLLITAYKQVEATVEHIEQQTLVGAHALAAEAAVKVQIQMDRRQALVAAAGAALALAGGKQVQLQTIFGL